METFAGHLDAVIFADHPDAAIFVGHPGDEVLADQVFVDHQDI